MQEADLVVIQQLVVWGCFAVAFVLGALMNKTNFCTMGAVADIMNMGDWTRMRMWLAAIAVAIMGTQGMAALGLLDLSKSFYTLPALTWLSNVLGGLLFGVGMVLASGCGSKTLVRLGGGSLKALVVFVVLGVAAYITMRGLFAVWRVASIDTVQVTLAAGQDLPKLFGAGDAGRVTLLRWLFGLAVGLSLLVFCFKSEEFRSRDGLLGGLGVGLGIVFIWYLSGHIGFVAEHPRTLEAAYIGTNSGRPESLTFVAPIAYTLELLMLWSDKSRMVTVGISTTLGMIAGSFVYAVATRQFRWEGFSSTEDTANHVVGAALMGVGGVTAMGCTVGQGLSGLSTLALGSFIAFAGIIAGAMLGIRYQSWRIEQME